MHTWRLFTFAVIAAIFVLAFYACDGGGSDPEGDPAPEPCSCAPGTIHPYGTTCPAGCEAKGTDSCDCKVDIQRVFVVNGVLIFDARPPNPNDTVFDAAGKFGALINLMSETEDFTEVKSRGVMIKLEANASYDDYNAIDGNTLGVNFNWALTHNINAPNTGSLFFSALTAMYDNKSYTPRTIPAEPGPLVPCDCTVKVHPYNDPCACGTILCDCTVDFKWFVITVDGYNITVRDGRPAAVNTDANTLSGRGMLTKIATLLNLDAVKNNPDFSTVAGNGLTILVEECNHPFEARSGNTIAMDFGVLFYADGSMSEDRYDFNTELAKIANGEVD